MELPAPRSPNRVTGLPPGVEVGPLGTRSTAQLIDLVVPVVALVLLVVVVPGLSGAGAVGLGLFAGLILVAWLLLTWRMFALQAAGPGMRVMKLQLVGFSDGRPLGWTRFLVRQLFLLALTLSVVGLVIMVVLLARHPRRQGWPDQAANSVVIVQRALAPTGGSQLAGRDLRAGGAAAVAVAAAPPAGGPNEAYGDDLDGDRLDGDDLDRDGPDADEPDGGTPDGADTQGPGETTMVAPRAVWSAALDDGRVVAVEGLVLIGRNPQPQPGEEDALLIKIADQTRTVSKSHLALGIDDAGLFVIDRGSTNGSVVTGLDGSSLRCEPGQVVSVEEGSIVSLGDHWLEIRCSLS